VSGWLFKKKALFSVDVTNNKVRFLINMHRYFISLFHRAFQFTMCNGRTIVLVCNKTLIQMSHIKTLKITPTCLDHQLIIIWELIWFYLFAQKGTFFFRKCWDVVKIVPHVFPFWRLLLQTIVEKEQYWMLSHPFPFEFNYLQNLIAGPVDYYSDYWILWGGR
jgi:hypothetical protein